MPTSRYLRLVWSGALYDLVVTVGFATPWSARFVFAQLSALHLRFHLSGELVPAFAPLHMMFLNFTGSLVTMWSLYRLRRPSREAGLFDGWGRVAFATWEALAIVQGQSHLLVAFLAIELFFAVAQLVGYYAASHAHR